MSKVKRQANWPAQAVRALEVTIAKLCAEVDERHAIEIDDIRVNRSAKGGYAVAVSYFYDLDRSPRPAAKEPSSKRLTREQVMQTARIRRPKPADWSESEPHTVSEPSLRKRVNRKSGSKGTE